VQPTLSLQITSIMIWLTYWQQTRQLQRQTFELRAHWRWHGNRLGNCGFRYSSQRRDFRNLSMVDEVVVLFSILQCSQQALLNVREQKPRTAVGFRCWHQVLSMLFIHTTQLNAVENFISAPLHCSPWVNYTISTSNKDNKTHKKSHHPSMFHLSNAQLKEK